jgi:hypothetical protein
MTPWYTASAGNAGKTQSVSRKAPDKIILYGQFIFSGHMGLSIVLIV